MKKRISDIPKSDRPREKLQQKGAAALSDLELLAVLLGSGTKKHDVMTPANNILKVIDQSGGTADVNALQQIEGVGSARAALITAALEFARRRIRPEGTKISSPAEVLPSTFVI
jgi:DNA repair protein RadC